MKNRESKKNKKGLYLKVSLAMLMTACVVTGGVFAAQNFSTRVDDTTVWEQGNAQASSIASTGGYETIDKYYILKAGSMKDDWEAATSDSTLVGKTLHFKLDSDWDLDTGVDALTGVAIPPNPAVSLPAQVRKSLNIPNGYDIILDLNGHKIDRQLASFVNMRIGHVINIEAGAKLTLEDSVGTGVITGGNQGVYSFDQGGGAGGVVNFGTFIMNGGNIRGNMGTWTGGVDSFGTFILNGGRIENNSQGIVFHAAAGVAIYTGDFTMNGGFIGNNAFNANSNAQRMPQLSLWGDAHNGVGGHTYTINGGTIGGSRLFGIKLYGGATLNMYGGEITGCERAPVFMDPVPTEKQANNDNINNPYRGSDVAYLSSKTTFNMYGGSIHDNDTSANSATNDGQIVRIANNEFNMYGGSIKDNKTGSLATIVAKGTSSAKAIINIHGGSIDNNDATGTNGSIISYTDTLYMMDGGTISENTCTGNVIFPVDTNDTFKLYGGSICNNKADYYAIGYGGALTMEVKGAPQVYGNSGGDVLLGAGNAIKIVGRLDTPDGWARIGIKLFTNGSATPNQNKFIIPAGKVYKVTDGFGDYYSDDVPNPNPETVGEKPTVPESDVLPANTFFFADNDPRLTSPKQDLCMKANKAYNNGTTNTYAVTKDAVLANNAGENIYEKWYYEKSTDLGNWHEIEGGTLELTYGDFDVTNVRLVYKGPKTCGGTGVGDDGTIYTDVFSTEYTGWSTPGQYPIRIYSDSNGGKSFSTIHDAGTYTLANYDGGPIRAYTWLYNASVRIVVKPKEVKINFKTGQKVTYGYNATELDTRLSSTAAGEIMYEVDANTPLVGSDTIASLGITVKHSYGTDAGKNYTMIASLPTATKYGYAVSNCANPNYTVVFGNRAGTFEIEPRPVTVILNDDYGTYGDSTTNKKLQQSETTDAEINGTSSILATAKNDSTRYKATDNTTDVTIASPATGVKADAYKGGWYYSTDIGGGKASQEFLTFDISNRFPFKYEFGFTASSDVWSGDSDKWLLAKDYYVTVTTANPNYTVTYQNAQDSTKSNTFKYTVRKAEITVDETSLPKTDGVSSYRISEYDNTKKTITFPSAAVIRKGAYTSPVPATLPSELKFDVTFWGTTFSDEQVAATDFKTKTEPKATDTGWTSTMPTIKDAGKYHVYVKIHVENHNDKVYDVIYTVKPQELDYEIQFWRKPKAGDAEQKLEKKSGAYSEQYNGQAITAKVEIVWNAPATKPSYYDTDPGRPVFTFYYKGTGTNTYGTAANTDFPDNSGKKPDGTTDWNLGNSNAPVNGGGYTASFVETPNKNYVVKTGGGRVRAESFTIEQREVDAPTAPTGTYYYNSTVQTITVPKFDADAMEFIEDTTNKYVVEPDPVPATHPVDDGTSALTFDKDAKAVKVKNAGDYKIKFKIKDTANYKWSDGGTDANREVTITVKGAPIKSTWTNDLDGMPWSWEAGAKAVNITYAIEYKNGTAYQATSPYQTGGVDDVVKVKLYWKASTDADTDKAACNSSDISGTTLNIPTTSTTFGTSGGYVLILEIDSTDAVSKNYAWDDTEADPTDRVNFTVDSASVNTKAFAWEYISNKTNASKAAWTSTSELKFAYKDETTLTDLDGLSYTFNLKMGAGDKISGYTYISIDTTRYPTGAYKLEKWDDSASDWKPATVLQDLGKYRWVVGLVIDASDTEHKFESANCDGDGTDDHKGFATLEVEMKKGEFDLTNVKWGYIKDSKEVEYTKPFEYNGSAQSIQLINLPKGLSVNNYNNNKKTAVGYDDKKYTASVPASGLVADLRFNKPVIADNPTIFNKDWEIVEGKIKTDWDMKESGTGAIYYLPIYKDSSVTVVDVKYYLKADYDADPDTASEVALKDIKYDPTNPVTYVAVMSIKPDESGNYVLVNESGVKIDLDVNPNETAHMYEFTPGDGQTPVKLEISHIDGIDTYNGKHQLKIDIVCTDTSITIDKFTVEIYPCTNEGDLAENIIGEPLVAWTPSSPNDPVNVGKYVIAIGFTADVSTDNFALMSNKFFFEIKKANVSGLLGGLGWGFIEPKKDEHGNKVTDSEGNPVMEEKPYDAQYTIDYELEKGENGLTPITHTPVIIGLPTTEEKLNELKEKGLVDPKMTLPQAIEILKLYGILDEDGKSAITAGEGFANRGTYTTTFGLPSNLGKDDAGNDNFDPVEEMMPAGLVDMSGTPIPLTWEIGLKLINVPVSTTVVFCEEGHNLLEALGLLPADLDVYYTVELKMVNAANMPVDYDGDGSVSHMTAVGKYQLTFALKDTTNVKWLDGETQKAAINPVTVTIEKLVLSVSGWEGTDEEAAYPFLKTQQDKDADWTKYLDLVLTDKDGNKFDQNGWVGKFGKSFTQTFTVKEAYADSVSLSGDGVKEGKLIREFTVPFDTSITVGVIEEPTLEAVSKEYVDGGVKVNLSGVSDALRELFKQNLVDFYIDGTKVGGADELILTAGEHTIRLDLNGYFKWKNASEEKGNIVTSVSYEFEISKQQLALPTLSNFAFTGLSYGDAAALQELGVLSGFDSTKMSLTTSKTLRNADTYTVTIAIKDEYVDNYEFAQSNGTVTLPLAALLDGETDDLATVTPTSSTTLDYTLTIHRAKLASPKAPNCPNITYLEDGTPMYVLPAEYTDNGAEVVFGRMVYDSAASQTALADGSEIEKNKDYWYVFSIGGKDANNFEFDGGSIDKNGIASSTRDYSYAIPLSGAAAFFQNVMTFLKSWWWILLIALALLLLILIIVIAVKRKKKKQILIEEQRKREFEEERIRQEQLEEQRRADAEAKEERKREEERRREEERKEEKRMEREERMAELRSQQMMQHMMPQMPPQMMQQPQIQQQPQMPQMPQMPMMPQMMMPQMMQQFGGGDSAADEYQTSEAIRIAEERTRAAEDRARLAEERIARIAQEAQNQAVSPAYPQMPMLPNGMPMNGMYPGMQPQMPMQPMMPQMPMVQQPLPQTAPTRDTTVKITENAANMLGEAIVSSLTHMILGNNNSNAQQQAPQAAPAAQAQQPAMSVQINMPPTAQPAQQPTVTAQPAQQSAPQSENQPAQQPAESGNNSDIPRRRLRL